MPRGRKSAPDTTKDGNWFRHKGLPAAVSAPPQRKVDTTTEEMLCQPFNDSLKTLKFPALFTKENSFSLHDNRNTIQSFGEYFGDGRKTRTLGRYLTRPVENRLHSTSSEFLKHLPSRDNTEANTTYSRHFYEHKQPASEYRRFPKNYPEPNPEKKMSTNTLTSCEIPPLPTTQTLADTLEPYIRHNSWKYSYHSENTLYPRGPKYDNQQPLPIWLVQGTPKVCTSSQASF